MPSPPFTKEGISRLSEAERSFSCHSCVIHYSLPANGGDPSRGERRIVIAREQPNLVPGRVYKKVTVKCLLCAIRSARRYRLKNWNLYERYFCERDRQLVFQLDNRDRTCVWCQVTGKPVHLELDFAATFATWEPLMADIVRLVPDPADLRAMMRRAFQTQDEALRAFKAYIMRAFPETRSLAEGDTLILECPAGESRVRLTLRQQPDGNFCIDVANLEQGNNWQNPQLRLQLAPPGGQLAVTRLDEQPPTPPPPVQQQPPQLLVPPPAPPIVQHPPPVQPQPAEEPWNFASWSPFFTPAALAASLFVGDVDPVDPVGENSTSSMSSSMKASFVDLFGGASSARSQCRDAADDVGRRRAAPRDDEDDDGLDQ